MSIRFGKLTRHPSQTANFANQTEIFGHSLFQHVICKANPEPNPFSLCLQSKTVLQLRSVERFATLFFFETFGWMQPQHPRRNITVICAMFGMEIYFSYESWAQTLNLAIDQFGPNALHNYDGLCCSWPWRASCANGKELRGWHTCYIGLWPISDDGQSRNIQLDQKRTPVYMCMMVRTRKVRVRRGTRRTPNETAKTCYLCATAKIMYCTLGFPRNNLQKVQQVKGTISVTRYLYATAVNNKLKDASSEIASEHALARTTGKTTGIITLLK